MPVSSTRVNIVQFTSPILAIRVRADLADCDIYLTVESISSKDTFKGENVCCVDGVTTFRVDLGQKITGSWKIGTPLRMQINWIAPDGTRGATAIRRAQFTGNLLNEVMNYGESV